MISIDYGDPRGLRYGSYRKPFPLDKIRVLRRTHDVGGPLQQQVNYPEPVDTPPLSGRAIRTANRRRMRYMATSQWFERRVGGGPRSSPAYTQFAGLGDIPSAVVDVAQSAVAQTMSDPKVRDYLYQHGQQVAASVLTPSAAGGGPAAPSGIARVLAPVLEPFKEGLSTGARTKLIPIGLGVAGALVGLGYLLGKR